MYIYVFIYIYIYLLWFALVLFDRAYLCIRAFTNFDYLRVCTYILTYAYTHTHVHTYVYTYTNTRTLVHSSTRISFLILDHIQDV